LEVILLVKFLHKNFFIFLLIVGLGLVILLVSVIQEPPEEDILTVASDVNTTNEVDSTEQENTIIIVDVKGEVNVPGVYEMSVNARVNDVIKEAGGFTDKADQTMVNLAQKVFDEMTIIVPLKGEQTGASPENQQNKIRINYATEEEMQQITGIGPSKAKAIIAHREEHGYFKKLEELLNVTGIGEKTLEIIQDEVQIP
jgi:competence protein ComEA